MPQSPRHPRTSSNRPRRPSPRTNRAPSRSAGSRSSGRPAATRPVSGPAAELDRQLAAAFAAPAPAVRTFAELGLPAPIIAELTRRGIEAPFAIQARTMPDALAGRDVLGRAQTGSGKTLAFGLPMLARLAGGVDARRAGTPRGLVLVPTRELAQQVTDALVPAWAGDAA